MTITRRRAQGRQRGRGVAVAGAAGRHRESAELGGVSGGSGRAGNQAPVVRELARGPEEVLVVVGCCLQVGARRRRASAPVRLANGPILSCSFTIPTPVRRRRRPRPRASSRQRRNWSASERRRVARSPSALASLQRGRGLSRGRRAERQQGKYCVKAGGKRRGPLRGRGRRHAGLALAAASEAALASMRTPAIPRPQAEASASSTEVP